MIHPQLLSAIDPVKSIDPIQQAGKLADLQTSMRGGVLQNQQIAAGQDAATTRATDQQKEAAFQKIFSTPGAIGLDGKVSPESIQRGMQIDPIRMGNMLKATGQDANTQSEIAGRNSNIQRDTALTQQGKDTLAETNRHNLITEAPKPIEVSGGASLMSPAGQVLGTAPKAETPNNLQHVPVIDPRNPNQPILASYDDRKGVFLDQSGAVIPNARPVPTLATMGDTAGLTPEAKAMLAQQLLSTGQIPNIGSGAAGAKLRTDIVNQAASGGATPDLAGAGASFKADSSSLTALQKNRDAVVAFENTAGKNLDLFLNQAKGVVDSGSPWINKPLRTVAQGGLGSADLSAFNAARQVAINEIAKVTSNPGLTGQLSDSARHEVEAFIPADATLKQIYGVAKVLKQDMANRHVSYDDQIKEIKGRLQTKPQGAGAPKLGDTKTFPNGKTGKWDGQGWVAQ